MREIEFFFDIGSSYSYLAATQIEAVGARSKTPVRWRPFLLGAVFKATGNELPIKIPRTRCSPRPRRGSMRPR